jgi:hypothetical protein
VPREFIWRIGTEKSIQTFGQTNRRVAKKSESLEVYCIRLDTLGQNRNWVSALLKAEIIQVDLKVYVQLMISVKKKPWKIF